MNITLNPTSASKRSKNKLQARFDKLRQQLLKQQKINRKFQDELDELVTLYQTQTSQMDSELVGPLTLLGTKLIDFYGRKSLSQWHREELGDWLIETLGRIGRVEAETADELHGHFRQVMAGQMGMTEAELDEEAMLFAKAFEEALEAEGNTESAAKTAFDADDFQEDLFGFNHDFEEGDEGLFDEDDAYDHELGDTKARRQRLMDGSWVRDLFRRAAQALHPDREPDPEQRQVKERAMQQLLEARKQGDILTLLNLYGESVVGGDLVLAEREITSACELMEEQLCELRVEKSDFIYEHPLRMLVHDLFYSDSRKTREKRIKAWKQNLKAEAKHTLVFIEELRNLKVLKAVLEERRDERFFSDLDLY